MFTGLVTPRIGPPEAGRRAVFSEFTNSGYWLPAYEAQNKAMDKHMIKYGLQAEDWRPGLFKQIRDSQK